MRKLALVLVLLSSLFMVLPANAKPSITTTERGVLDSIHHCSGYATVAFYQTAGGNNYWMTENQCIGTSSGNTTFHQSVSHAKCYRNGVLWDGCRIDTTVGVQAQTYSGGWTTRTGGSADWHFPIGAYFSDSGTTFGPFVEVDPVFFAAVRTAENWSGVVRFLLADGTTHLSSVDTRLSLVNQTG
jgi:hypothetical protein